ncbi:thioredoxin family protein [Micromonospora arida]|uniref:thioredoxin family protein n=1 Tax=Micromonospora arida TaxID=2203715 RepID=UPI003CFAD4C9
MIRVLYFTAAWCGPCRSFGPMLTREAEARGLKVERIDLDEVDGRAIALAHDVQSVPTVVVLRRGALADRFGALPASAVRDRLDAVTEPA